MKMTSKSLQEILEFDKIINMLRGYTSSSATLAKIQNLAPLSTKWEVEDALTETEEAVSVILYKGSIPLSQVPDVSSIVNRALKSAVLSPRELLLILRLLETSRDIKQFLSHDMPDSLNKIPEIAALLSPNLNLLKALKRTVINDEEISSDASPRLREIRNSLDRQNSSIRDRLRAYIKTAESKGTLQDQLITLRNERFVIPVKKESLGQIPGIIHDQSKSGSTYFVEPESIVKLNNQIKQTKLEEEAEINRILGELSALVAANSASLLADYTLLIELDFYNAKAKLSIDMSASRPGITDSLNLSLLTARHPMLPYEQAVPIDVEMSDELKCLLITGPNTGGKTVALKTVGLLTMMTLSGLNIPASPNSLIPMLDNIYADIGDEQSIEQSLSTFSSHMSNIVRILDDIQAGKKSMCILDELGSGTDPNEGAALSIAILTKLMQFDSLVLCSTHYTELKKFALENPFAQNASMEFDAKTLSPTYHLRVGSFGKSQAFEISEKLGLDKSIIDLAREQLDEEYRSFNNAVSQIESVYQEQSQHLSDTKLMRDDALAMLQDAKQEKNRARDEYNQIIHEAQIKASEILADAMQDADNLNQEIRQIKQDLDNNNIDVSKAYGNIVTAKSIVRTALREIDSEIDKSVTIDPDNIRPGQEYYAIPFSSNCEIIGVPDKTGKVQVRIGSIKASIDISSLEPAHKTSSPKTKPSNRLREARKLSKSQTISPEINLIGKNLEEAIELMNKYIDDALLSGLSRVSIIHGRGQGVLQLGLREELSHLSCVKSYSKAPYNQGGDGVTIVELG